MIADTSAWVALFRATGTAAHLTLRQALARGEPVLMLDTVYQELLQGTRGPQHFAHLQSQLDAMPLWQPDDPHETARLAAMLYARCRWQGFTIRSPNDCLIAACAIEAGEPLLQADRDFLTLAGIDPRLHLL